VVFRDNSAAEFHKSCPGIWQNLPQKNRGPGNGKGTSIMAAAEYGLYAVSNAGEVLINPAVVHRYFLWGLLLPSQLQSITILSNYTVTSCHKRSVNTSDTSNSYICCQATTSSILKYICLLYVVITTNLVLLYHSVFRKLFRRQLKGGPNASANDWPWLPGLERHLYRNFSSQFLEM